MNSGKLVCLGMKPDVMHSPDKRNSLKGPQNMDSSTIISLKSLLFAMLVLILYPKTESQWVPHIPVPPINPPPLCASQFALVNHACSLLPYTPIPPPSPRSQNPPSSLRSKDESNGQHHSRHGHRHRNRHRHRNHWHTETSVEEDCCRWLKEVDSVCVCDLLVHLPPFLLRPVHNYTVVVDETCEVTFACSSRWLRV